MSEIALPDELNRLANLISRREACAFDVAKQQRRLAEDEEKLADLNREMDRISAVVIAALSGNANPTEGVAAPDGPVVLLPEHPVALVCDKPPDDAPAKRPLSAASQRVLQALRDAEGKPLFTSELPFFQDERPGPILAGLARSGKARKVSNRMWQAIL